MLELIKPVKKKRNTLVDYCDIKNTFEFVYPAYVLNSRTQDETKDILKKLGGIEEIVLDDWSAVAVPINSNFRYGYTVSFYVSIFKFPEHQIKAYFISETHPQMRDHPYYLVRIRLADYTTADDFPRKVSNSLRKAHYYKPNYCRRRKGVMN